MVMILPSPPFPGRQNDKDLQYSEDTKFKCKYMT